MSKAWELEYLLIQVLTLCELGQSHLISQDLNFLTWEMGVWVSIDGNTDGLPGL